MPRPTKSKRSGSTRQTKRLRYAQHQDVDFRRVGAVHALEEVAHKVDDIW